MRIKRFAALILGCFLCVGAFGTLTGCGKKSASNEFIYWMAASEKAEYYTGYNDNPVVRYINNHKTFENENGEQQNLSVEFKVPAVGDEISEFTRMLQGKTKDLPDIIDMRVAGVTLAEMYEDGKIADLTSYIEDGYMPNYKAYIDAHPEYAAYLTTEINGDRKYLSVMEAKEVNDIYTTDFGFQYRRDWIIKYGKDPSTNEKFTGHYTKNTDGTERNDPMKSDTTLPNGADAMSWADNIRFPSHYGLSYVNGDDTLQENDSLKTFYGQYKDTYGWDGNDPVTISDWEWMFRIFEEPIGQIRKAGKGGKDSDSYCLSIYNPGYIANGDLVCAFGGGGPCWYRDGDVAKFGVTDEDEGFRTYLQTMNKWYDKTWLDNTFASNTDVFYQIDLNTGIMQGKVGLWMGSQATFGNGIYNEKQTNTHGAVVSGASQPINDVYGNDSVKYAIPYTMYGGTTTLGSSIVVSANAAETKDMKLLLGYIDFFYGEEGSVMKQLGLSKEQYEESQDPLYKKYGLTNGAYTVTEDSDGSKTYQYVKALEENNGEIRSAMTGTLLIGLAANEDIFYDYPELRVNSLQQWRLYPNIGFFDGAFNTLRSTELVIKYEAARVAVETEYMYVQVPKLIKGERDPYNNSDWNGFVSACRNRGCDDILDDYTALIKMINKL